MSWTRPPKTDKVKKIFKKRKCIFSTGNIPLPLEKNKGVVTSYLKVEGEEKKNPTGYYFFYLSSTENYLRPFFLFCLPYLPASTDTLITHPGKGITIFCCLFFIYKKIGGVEGHVVGNEKKNKTPKNIPRTNCRCCQVISIFCFVFCNYISTLLLQLVSRSDETPTQK